MKLIKYSPVIFYSVSIVLQFLKSSESQSGHMSGEIREFSEMSGKIEIDMTRRLSRLTPSTNKNFNLKVGRY